MKIGQLSDDPRFAGLRPFARKVWLATPTMHGEELAFVREAFETNWVSTVGANINELEKAIAASLGMREAVALSSGTAAVHMCVKLAARRLCPENPEGNTLAGCRVFCSDMTFDATVNPIIYEGGEPIFIETEYDSWNMSPEALRRAFEMYPDVRLVVLVHLYGVPARMDEILSVCREHGALVIEDAAEAVGASYRGSWASGMCGSFGDYAAISFNANKIVTGSSGGMFVTNSPEDAEKVRKWSAQSREAAPWYQHEELGYNYRMSNIIAGIARGNLLHLQAHIAQKKRIYERYRAGFADLPVRMNPFDAERMTPNYWLSCLTIDPDFMAPQARGDKGYMYGRKPGKSSPQEILDALSAFNAEGRPIWKPMHMQPLYQANGFVWEEGDGRRRNSAGVLGDAANVGADLFDRGCCLPSDNKMTEEDQDRIIEIVRRCFA